MDWFLVNMLGCFLKLSSNNNPCPAIAICFVLSCLGQLESTATGNESPCIYFQAAPPSNQEGQKDEGRYFTPPGSNRSSEFRPASASSQTSQQKLVPNTANLQDPKSVQAIPDELDPSRKAASLFDVNREQIAAAIAELETATGVDEAQKEAILKNLKTADQFLDAADQFAKQTVEFQSRIDNIPRTLQEVEQKLVQPPQPADHWVQGVKSADKTIDELRQMVSQMDEYQKERTEYLAARQAEIERRRGQMADIPPRLDELSNRIKQLQTQAKAAPPESELPIQTKARLLLIQAEGAKSERELASLRKELERYRAAQELLPKQAAVAQLEIELTQQRLEILRQYFQQQQQVQLEVKRQETIRRIEAAGPLFKAFIRHDLLDMQQLQKSQAAIVDLAKRHTALVGNRASRETQFETHADRFANIGGSIGGSSALGVILRQRRKELLESRSELQSARGNDEETRLNVEELSLLLLNELEVLENERVYIQQFKDFALKAVNGYDIRDLEKVERHMAADNNELVVVLSGMPIEGTVHRDELERMRGMLAREINQLIPSLSAAIEKLRTDTVFSVLQDFNRDDVKELAQKIYLLQNQRVLLPEQSQQYLNDTLWRRFIEFGEKEFENELTGFLRLRIEKIRNLRNALSEQSVKLAELDDERRVANSLIKDYLSWIDGRVIWIRSAATLAPADIEKSQKALVWFFTMEKWRKLAADLLATTKTSWFTLAVFAAISFLVLFFSRGRLKSHMWKHGELAAKKYCSSIKPTLYALMYTVLLAAFWPLLVMAIGQLLRSASSYAGFGDAVGYSLIIVGLFLGSLELLRSCLIDQGLAQSHFKWPERTRTFLRWRIRTFYSVVIPLVFAQTVLFVQPNEDHRNSLGRLLSCALFLILTWYLHTIFRPRGVIFQQMAVNNQLMGLYRFRYLAYATALLLPILLLALSISGFYFTAFQLAGYLEKSLAIIIAIILIGGTMFRWLLVQRRASALEEARKARQAMQEASQEQNEIAAEVKTAAIEQAIEEMVEISRQSRQVVVLVIWLIVLLGLYYVWLDFIPAFKILDNVELWPTTVGSEVRMVTLLNLFKAGLTLFATWLVVKNMPGLLNMVVQEFSMLDAGARYAATTLFRYLIVIVGLISAANFLSVQWSQLGWLVAAISIGLGFGLQEIVANFVSGLILLFERPVRIGDTITVNDQVGIVTRIQMRATTIRTWDMQELVIPNKDLVTSQLLNWTLSSSTNRLTLPIGVAYGNDPDRVLAILTNVVTSHPDVMSDPGPLIGLDNFGDSALNFYVRCYLEKMDRRTSVRHELNTAIANAFASEGISIPFPQMDLHVVSGLEKLPGNSNSQC